MKRTEQGRELKWPGVWCMKMTETWPCVLGLKLKHDSTPAFFDVIIVTWEVKGCIRLRICKTRTII